MLKLGVTVHHHAANISLKSLTVQNSFRYLTSQGRKHKKAAASGEAQHWVMPTGFKSFCSHPYRSNQNGLNSIGASIHNCNC